MKILYRLCVYCILISSSLSANAAVDYEIKGSTDQQATDNIKVYLSAISAPTSIDNISYLNEVEETAKESLTATGYYQPEITTSINEQADKQTVILNVNLGQRITITEVDLRITGEALQDANFQQYMLDFPIKEGDI
ncbi:POTRA domain-containing protein [Psychromonas sp. KJ10-2]|uniref:POTRA domain-containing protein n=1 Tax=Psychromonas sp. KJ10-2 TaxID=3391822 RepID=UPI0039B6E690